MARLRPPTYVGLSEPVMIAVYEPGDRAMPPKAKATDLTDLAPLAVSEDAIRQRAYYLWEADGRPDGRGEHYWHLAAAEAERAASPAPLKPTRRARPAAAKPDQPATAQKATKPKPAATKPPRKPAKSVAAEAK